MLDIKFIRENKEKVKEAAKNKNIKVDIDELLKLDEERRGLKKKIDDSRTERNKLAKNVKTSRPDEKTLAEGKKLKEQIAGLEKEYNEIEEKYNKLIFAVPNVYSDDTPIGPDESGNKVIKQVGKIPNFKFKPKEHWQLGEELDVIDMARGVKVSGTRFGYLKGELAILEFALVQYAFSVMTDEKILAEIIKDNHLEIEANPFIPVVPPVMIKPEVFQKMARLEPKEDKYYIPNDDLFLIGSAEHTLGSMHLDETLLEKDLPIRYVGFSTAFRREAGSYSKDLKGILRVHQFDKVEMESFTLPEKGILEQNFFVAIQEYLMQSLKIPYQVVAICSGDMGTPDIRQIDIEAWLPGQNKYRETHTSDYMSDYQARRLGTKVRRQDGRSEFAHMNDATVFALSRTPIAIMENYQQADSSIIIPEVLRKYMPGGLKVISKK